MSNKNNICIHIQTYTPHFKYTNQLINSFLYLTNIVELKIPIFIIFDNNDMINNFKTYYNYRYDLLYFLNIDEIINNIDLKFTEKFNNLFDETINIKWSLGHRDYAALKRTYSILELEKKGYKYIWCLDSESLVLKKIDINNIIQYNIEKPLLTLGINKTGIKYPEIIEKIFNFDYIHYQDISVRMNDFWFIHSEYFVSMINLLFDIHKKPISYFMGGSEQSLYEYYLYSLYLKDNNSINFYPINDDLHNNSLFSRIIHSNENIDNLCNILNSYFNMVQSYRGDYYQYCMTFDRGIELLKKLNISIAVSNYSESLCENHKLELDLYSKYILNLI